MRGAEATGTEAGEVDRLVLGPRRCPLDVHCCYRLLLFDGACWSGGGCLLLLAAVRGHKASSISGAAARPQRRS